MALRILQDAFFFWTSWNSYIQEENIKIYENCRFCQLSASISLFIFSCRYMTGFCYTVLYFSLILQHIQQTGPVYKTLQRADTANTKTVGQTAKLKCTVMITHKFLSALHFLYLIPYFFLHYQLPESVNLYKQHTLLELSTMTAIDSLANTV